MDYVSMMLQLEKNNRGPFDHLSDSNNNGINVRFQAAQQFMAQERAKKEAIKEPIKEDVKKDTPTKKRAKKEKIPASTK